MQSETKNRAGFAFLRQQQPLMLREDKQKNVFVHGAKEVEVSSPSQALEALLRGRKRRMVAHTSLNPGSSRSHAVCTIRVVKVGWGWEAQAPSAL